MKDQDAGAGGRLEVESGNGGGMDSSVEIAEVFMDTKKFVDMECGVGVYLFNGVEVWGSGADMRQSTSKDDAHDEHDNNENQTIDRRRRVAPVRR